MCIYIYIYINTDNKKQGSCEENQKVKLLSYLKSNDKFKFHF